MEARTTSITLSLKFTRDPGSPPVWVQEGRKTHLPTHTAGPLMPPHPPHTHFFALLAALTHLQIIFSLRKQSHILIQGWN